MAKKAYQLTEDIDPDDDDLIVVSSVDGSGTSRKVKKSNIVKGKITAKEAEEIAVSIALAFA